MQPDTSSNTANSDWKLQGARHKTRRKNPARRKNCCNQRVFVVACADCRRAHRIEAAKWRKRMVRHPPD